MVLIFLPYVCALELSYNASHMKITVLRMVTLLCTWSENVIFVCLNNCLLYTVPVENGANMNHVWRRTTAAIQQHQGGMLVNWYSSCQEIVILLLLLF